METKTPISNGHRGPVRADPPCRLALFPSDATTLLLGVWATGRFFGDAEPSWPIAAGAVAVGAAALALPSKGVGRLGGALGVAGVAAWAGLGGTAASGWKVAAVGCLLGVVLVFVRSLLRWAAGRQPLTLADGLRGALLQLAAAWALHPYVTSAIVGAGDAYHYGLMLADMIGQLRAHIFPVFVGQTEFGLNGNIHTLRTAPFYVHFGGALDFLTFHTLPIFAVQHLALLLAAAAGALGAYATLRRHVPDRPWASAALAALFILCPGVLVPLYEGDMIATFMTVPMLPWLVYGLAQAADDPRAWKPWGIQAAALAGLWWAHPPIAIWASVLVLGNWVVLLLVPPRTGKVTLRAGFAVWTFLALATYVFVSVTTLDLVPPAGIEGAGYDVAIAGNLALAWPAAFLPLAGTGDAVLGDLQIGYSLLAAALLGLGAIRTRTSARMLAIGLAGFVLLLLPVPWLARHLWGLVPVSVLDVTNVWPMQRFYVILAALAAFLGMAGLRRLGSRGRIAHLAANATLVLALGWSASEAHKLFARGLLVTGTPAAGQQSLTAEDLKLTRSSYLVFNFFPPFFSHAPIDVALESRLYDADSNLYFASGATPRAGQGGAATTSVELVQQLSKWNFEPTFTVPPGQTLLLHFDFLGQQPKGALQFISPRMSREYLLPSSGEPNSFGATPASSRFLTLPNSSTSPEVVRAQFVPDGAPPTGKEVGSRPFARVTSELLHGVPRAVEVDSLVPLGFRVHSPRAALLETPRMFVPGYQATVNGKVSAVVRTSDGLAGVFLPPGESRVEVGYRGGLLLRATYWLALAGWLTLAGGSLWLPPAAQARLRTLLQGREFQRRALRVLRPVGLATVGSLAVAAAVVAAAEAGASARTGAIKMVLELPLGLLKGAQPLLCTGRTGAADVIYVKYLGGGQLQVGHDHWGGGATLSAPFQVDWSRPQEAEISMDSLEPTGATGGRGPRGLSVRWNGRRVLTESAGIFPTTAREVVIGANPVGASTCSPAFGGTILSVTRDQNPSP